MIYDHISVGSAFENLNKVKKYASRFNGVDELVLNELCVFRRSGRFKKYVRCASEWMDQPAMQFVRQKIKTLIT